MVQLPTVAENTDILQVDQFFSPIIFLEVHYGVIARTHRRKEGVNGKLENGFFSLCGLVFIHFYNDGVGDQFLLFSFWVHLFIAVVLTL